MRNAIVNFALAVLTVLFQAATVGVGYSHVIQPIFKPIYNLPEINNLVWFVILVLSPLFRGSAEYKEFTEEDIEKMMKNNLMMLGYCLSLMLLFILIWAGRTYS